MTSFIINNNDIALGEMSFSQRLENGKIVIRGAVELNKYFEEINIIETAKFLITGVQIISESFGTKDKKVVYEFIANKLDIRIEELNKYLTAEGDDK